MSKEMKAAIALLPNIVDAILHDPHLSAARLAEIQRLEQSATRGPWIKVTSWENPSMFMAPGDLSPERVGWQILGGTEDPERNGYAIAFGYSEEGECVPRSENLAFASDARQAVPELLAEVLRLRGELAALTVNGNVGIHKLSVRSRRACERAGIGTLGELASKPISEMRQCKNLGMTGINEMRRVLAEHGLKFADD